MKRKLIGILGGALLVGYLFLASELRRNVQEYNPQYERVSIERLCEEDFSSKAVEVEIIPTSVHYHRNERKNLCEEFIFNGDIDYPKDILQVYSKAKNKSVYIVFNSYKGNNDLYEEVCGNIRKNIGNPITIRGLVRTKEVSENSINLNTQEIDINVDGVKKTYRLSDNPKFDLRGINDEGYY